MNNENKLNDLIRSAESFKINPSDKSWNRLEKELYVSKKSTILRRLWTPILSIAALFLLAFTIQLLVFQNQQSVPIEMEELQLVDNNSVYFQLNQVKELNEIYSIN